METTILGNGVYRFDDYWQLMFKPYDVFLGIVTTLIIYFIVKSIYTKKYSKSPLGFFFWKGFLFRIFCAWACSAIFRFYYGGGDSTMYHSGIIDISHESWSFWWEFMKDIFNKSHNWGRYGNVNVNAAYYMSGMNNAGVMRFGLLLNLFCFDSFLALALWYSLFAFWGQWKLYQVFVHFYPNMYKELGYVIMFYPSAIFWTSTLLKDPICIGALGFLVYSVTSIFFWKKNIIRNTAIAISSGTIIYIIKAYIIIAFAPALIFWLFMQYNHKIKSSLLRRFLAIFAIILSIIGSSVLLNKLTSSAETKRFSSEAVIESINQQVKNFNSTEGGSNFSLGAFDPSPTGLAKMFPKAVNATLFRPYIWEVRNPLMMISALESGILLVVTLIILFRFKFNLFKILNIVVSEPFVLFSLIFTIIFAGVIGLSTLNFGALVRYKTPCLPFFGLVLSVLWYKSKLYSSPNSKKHILLKPQLET
jgi:hypothetical protein